MNDIINNSEDTENTNSSKIILETYHTNSHKNIKLLIKFKYNVQ